MSFERYMIGCNSQTKRILKGYIDSQVKLER